MNSGQTIGVASSRVTTADAKKIHRSQVKWVKLNVAEKKRVIAWKKSGRDLTDLEKTTNVRSKNSSKVACPVFAARLFPFMLRAMRLMPIAMLDGKPALA
jgi:hypothetical protein